MNMRSVSVIVVSRGRGAMLRRCLVGLSRQTHDAYEIIVVTDPEGQAALRGHAGRSGLRVLPFDLPNISQARNLGIAAARGEVVAFIDDDAIAEPAWLSHLAAAFADPGTDIATGFVRGPDGIRFQSRAARIDSHGAEQAILPDLADSIVLPADPMRAIKTEGTNMAFRRDLLCAVGGFDPAFAFYMDETELNMRLAARGCSTAIVPAAEVHHMRAPSPVRQASGAPQDLEQVGRSLALFLQRHCPENERKAALAARREARRQGLVRHILSGRIEPRDLRPLIAGFDRGAASVVDGTLPGPPPPIPTDAGDFQSYQSDLRHGHKVIASRWMTRRKHMARAEALAREGHVVSLFILGPSARRHRLKMADSGVWIQTGGTFGRSEGYGFVVPCWRFGGRILRETARVARQRWWALQR